MDFVSDKEKRMNTLYFIQNERGEKVLFKMNKEQQYLYDNSHCFNFVLKARQLGVSTYCLIRYFDDLLFNSNIKVAITAQTLKDSKRLFEKLKFAYDNFPSFIKKIFRTKRNNHQTLSFDNGSSIMVDTSLRGGTFQKILFSDMGIASIKRPEATREMITGTLNTVHKGGEVTIESTAAGRAGIFYELYEQYKDKYGPLNEMNFKFFFFPWYNKKEYSQKIPPDFVFPEKLNHYFDLLKEKKIILSDNQKFWYFEKKRTQYEDMTREFPSFPEEAFESSKIGYWYVDQMKELRENKHICNVPHDKSELVYTAWDLGQADFMAIWFFQIIGANKHIIRYMQFQYTSLDLICVALRSFPYNYGTCILPHDSRATEKTGSVFIHQLENFGFECICLERTSILSGINIVRMKISSFFFDQKECEKGLQYLRSYKKNWDNVIGEWTSEPRKDESSHAADAMRYLCLGYDRVEKGGSTQETYDRAIQYLNVR